MARQRIKNDMDFVSASFLAVGHKTLLPQVVEVLKSLGCNDIIVNAGGVIPQPDYDYLFERGIAAVFGPESKIPLSTKTMLKKWMVSEDI